jgi:hypothetical protein
MVIRVNYGIGFNVDVPKEKILQILKLKEDGYNLNAKDQLEDLVMEFYPEIRKILDFACFFELCDAYQEADDNGEPLEPDVDENIW